MNHQLELRRLLDGKVGGLGAFENLVHVSGCVGDSYRQSSPNRTPVRRPPRIPVLRTSQAAEPPLPVLRRLSREQVSIPQRLPRLRRSAPRPLPRKRPRNPPALLPERAEV